MGWDWYTFVQLIFTAGVGSAIAQGLFVVRRDWRERNSIASYLALRILIALEEFAQSCSEVIGDNHLFEASSGEVGDQTTRLPNLATFPDDEVGWRSLEPRLAEQVLSLPNSIASAQLGIEFCYQVTHEDEAIGMCLDQCKKLGLTALNTARELRRSYGFAEQSPKTRERLGDHKMTALEEPK